MIIRRAALLIVAACALSGQAPAPAPAPTSAIPPIALQGCAQKVKAKHAHIFANSNANTTTVSGSSRGDQVVGFDISFVNTTEKTAKIVVIRIGATDFTKIGQFSPDAVIAWRIAARPGDCYVRAVRFVDGTEWTAPEPPPPAPDVMATP